MTHETNERNLEPGARNETQTVFSGLPWATQVRIHEPKTEETQSSSQQPPDQRIQSHWEEARNRSINQDTNERPQSKKVFGLTIF